MTLADLKALAEKPGTYIIFYADDGAQAEVSAEITALIERCEKAEATPPSLFWRFGAVIMKWSSLEPYILTILCLLLSLAIVIWAGHPDPK